VLRYSVLHAAMKALQNVAVVGVATGKMANTADGRSERKYDSFVILLF